MIAQNRNSLAVLRRTQDGLIRLKGGLIVLLIMLFVTGNAQTIIDDLQSNSDASEGVIRIESEPEITALIGVPNNPSESNDNNDLIERQGFRIQVFMENNVGKARSEATARQTAIRNVFPELPTYLTYVSPNWKLLAGDFITREEANIVKQQLQKEFPQFGKEMYIIADKIKIPVERVE